MNMNDLTQLATFVFIIVVAIFIIIFGLFLLLKHNDDTQEKVVQIRKEIRSYRIKRYENIKQIIQAFGQDNPHTKQLEKLRDLYKKVDSEEREMAWEEKYISVMHSFMDYAKDNISPQLKTSYDIANKALVDNEQALDTVRDEYLLLRKTLDLFEGVPVKYIIAVGEKLMSFTRKANETSVDLGEKIQDGIEKHQTKQRERDETLEELRRQAAEERKEFKRKRKEQDNK